MLPTPVDSTTNLRTVSNSADRPAWQSQAALATWVGGIAASFTAFIGAFALIGWHFQIEALSLLFTLSGQQPIAYETAAGLLFAGVGMLLILLERYWAGIICGVLVAVLIGLVMVRTVAAEPIGFFSWIGQWGGMNRPEAWAMSPLIAAALLALILATVSILMWWQMRSKTLLRLSIVLGSAVMGAGIAVIANVLFGRPFPIEQQVSMSIAAAIGMMLLGGSALCLVLQRDNGSRTAMIPRWMPLALTTVVLAGSMELALSAWTARRWAEHREFTLQDAGRATLLVGIVLAGLLGASSHVLMRASSRTKRQLTEFDTMCDAVPVGLCVVDTNLRIVRMNARMAALNREHDSGQYSKPLQHGRKTASHGQPARFSVRELLAEQQSSTVREAFPALADELEPRLRQVLHTGQPLRDQKIRLAAASGSDSDIGDWLISFTPLHDEQGEIFGVSIVAQDITVRTRHEQAMRLLSNASNLVANSLDYEATLAAVAQLAVPGFADWSSVEILEPGGTMRQVAVAHSDPARAALGRELRRRYPLNMELTFGVPNVVRTSQSELYEDIPDSLLQNIAQDPQELQALRKLGLRSAMIVPLIARGRTIGAMIFVSERAERRFTKADLLLAEELARRCAMAVDNARLYADLNRRISELQTLLSVMPVGVCMTNDLSCRQMTMNPTCAEILGLPPDVNPSMGGENADLLPFKIYRDGRELSVEELPMQYAMTHGREVRDFEAEIVRDDDGERRVISIYASPIVDSASLQVQGCVGVFVDITDRKNAEAALRESQDRLSIALEAGSMGVWSWDTCSGRLNWSATLEDIHGIPRGSFEGTFEAFQRDVHPDDREAVLNAIQRALHEDDEYEMTYRIILPDQRVRWVGGRGRVYRNEQGEPIRMAGVCMDVTERRTAQEALQESEERFRMLADAAPVMIWMTDQTMRAEYLNHQWKKFAGWESNETTQAQWIEAIHVEDRERTQQAYISAVDSRQQFQMEYRLRRHDGEYRWLLDIGLPRFSCDGTFLGYIGSCTDISELKQAEISLRTRARQQRAIARISQRALTVLDMNDFLQEALVFIGRTLRCSRVAFFEFTDREDELCLKAGVGFHHSEIGQTSIDRDDDPALFAMLLSDEPRVVDDWRSTDQGTESSFREKHGIASGVGVSIQGSDRAVGALAVFANKPHAFSHSDVHFVQTAASVLATAIARHRAGEELQRYREHLETLVVERTAALEHSHEQLRFAERLASIGTLATGLGHDIGNLVLPILCRLDYLLAQSLPDEALNELRAVRQAAVNLRRLGSGLRLFALDPHDATASVGSTDLHLWWAEAGSLLSKSLPRTAELSVELPENLPRLAIAPHQLTQAVFNLVMNAGEAITRDGWVRVWAQLAPSGREVKVGVTDNGRGMTEKVRRHAMDPFFTTKKRTLSTGLGLSMVRGIVESVGGSLELESTPNRGATATMTLPIVDQGDVLDDASAAARVARVEIKDQRIASYATALLQSSGFDIASNSDRPGEETLWITESTAIPHEHAEQFLRKRPERRIILVGAVPEQWVQQPGIIAVDGSYRELRQALHRAASTFNGGPSRC